QHVRVPDGGGRGVGDADAEQGDEGADDRAGAAAGGEQRGEAGQARPAERAGGAAEVRAGEALRVGGDGVLGFDGGPGPPGGEQRKSRPGGARQRGEAAFPSGGHRSHPGVTVRVRGSPGSSSGPGGHDGAPGRSPTAAGRTSASQQVRSPVWQAAPTWSTFTRTASPSQSSATDLTHCWWPEVSPFTQYSWRLRDQ